MLKPQPECVHTKCVDRELVPLDMIDCKEQPDAASASPRLPQPEPAHTCVQTTACHACVADHAHPSFHQPHQKDGTNITQETDANAKSKSSQLCHNIAVAVACIFYIWLIWFFWAVANGVVGKKVMATQYVTVAEATVSSSIVTGVRETVTLTSLAGGTMATQGA